MRNRAISILFAAVLITCFSFAVKQHQSLHQSRPVYRVYFSGKLPGASINKKEAANASAIVVKDEAGNSYEVKMLRMFLKTKEGRQEADAVGTEFTSLQKELLSEILSGTELIFDNIYFTGKSGRQVKIDKASYPVK
jgi:hypothetical protein